MYRTLLVFGLGAMVPLIAIAEDASDTPKEANKMKNSVKETLLSAADLDFYKFTISTDRANPEHDTSGKLTVILSQAAPSIRPDTGWQVKLFAETNLAQPLYTAVLPETSLKVEFEQGLSPGNYYFQVSSLNDTVFPEAEYTLARLWEETPYYERESNDKAEDATAIIVNQLYYGNLSSGSDLDFYRFGLEVPDTVTISLGQETPAFDSTIGWQLTLLTGNNQPPVDMPSNKMSVTLQANLDVGMHYLVVGALPQDEEPQDEEPQDEEPQDEGAIENEDTIENEGMTESAVVRRRYQLKEATMEKAPVGQRYQLKVEAPSVAPLPAQEACPFVFTYAQNPQTNRWASFPTPCDVPAGWFSQPTAPDSFEVCPSPHASYTLPQVDESGNITGLGKVKIPLLDFKDETNGNTLVLRVELLQETLDVGSLQFVPDMLNVDVLSVIEPE